MSVEAAIDVSVDELCRSSPRMGDRYGKVRLSSFGRLRAAGFALLPTFAHPHFDVVLPDLSEVTVGGSDAASTSRSPTPADGLGGNLVQRRNVTTNYDLWVDFMRMQDDGRLRTRLRHARAGFVPVAGRYVIVGSEDADAAVAKILSVDAEGAIEVQVLPGKVDEHRAGLTPTG